MTLNVRPEFLIEHFSLSSADVPPRLEGFLREAQSTIDFCQVLFVHWRMQHALALLQERQSLRRRNS